MFVFIYFTFRSSNVVAVIFSVALVFLSKKRSCIKIAITAIVFTKRNCHKNKPYP